MSGSELRRKCATRMRAEQFLHAERLGQVAVSAPASSASTFLTSSPTALRTDDGYTVRGPQLLADVDARTVRQYEVEEDHLRAEYCDTGERACTATMSAVSML